MENPFRYGDIATGAYFTNRVEELKELDADLRSGQNVVIISPRRYGKTSLVLKAVEKLRRDGVLVAYLDLFRTPTQEKLAEHLARALFDGLVNPVERTLNQALDWFKQLAVKPQVSLTEDGTPTLELAPAARTRDVEQTLDRLLELPGRIAERRKRRVVLVLDEFQEVVGIDPGLTARMRAIFQTQPEVAHLFLGSKRHLMEHVFTNVNEPMYKMAKPLSLLPIGRDDFKAFIAERFAASRRTIESDAVDRILDITSCHPHDTQELCYFVWSQPLPASATVTTEVVERALSRVIQAEDARYTAVWESLSANQRSVLTSLALDPGPVYAEGYRRAHKLGAASAVQRSIQRLMEKELLEASASAGYAVPDVFLRAWLRRLATGT